MRSMYCNLLLRNGTVYLPTMGKMGEGFYRGIEPVAVVAAQNVPELRAALIAAIARGNPVVPMLKRRDWPLPVVLKYAGVKNWSAFERGLRIWDIEEKDGVARVVENIKSDNRMWVENPEQAVTFQPDVSTDNVVDRMIEILQSAAE
jgi:hypothetical protein